MILKTVRIVSSGWENYTGPIGYMAKFENGVSTTPLNPRQIAVIGASLQIVDDETGEQLGPAAVMSRWRGDDMPVFASLETPKVEAASAVDEEAERQRLVDEAKEQKKADEAAAEAAERRAAEAGEEPIIYSRVELEGIATDGGIAPLREIAKPLGVTARSISDMITAILEAQTKLASE